MGSVVAATLSIWASALDAADVRASPPLAGDLTPTSQIPAEAAKPPFVTSARRLFTAPEALDAPDEWIDRSLQWVDFILDAYKPAIPEHPLRRAALIRLDDILHIPSAPQKALVQAWYRARIERAVAEIEHTHVAHGMRVWKLYNHGFVVRTPAVTLAFDIVPGVPQTGFLVPPGLIGRIAAQSDVLFVSHRHADHASPGVALQFLKAGKPVVAPEMLWKDQPGLARRLTVLERSTIKTHALPVHGGKQTVDVVAYPGDQEGVPNNLILVTTPDGFTVVHTGDEWQMDQPGDDFSWIADIGRDHKVDVLLPNIWTFHLDRMVRGINPALVISGHENEMGHTVPHREDYTQSYNRLFGIRYPSIVMAWGESYLYDRVDCPPTDRTAPDRSTDHTARGK